MSITNENQKNSKISVFVDFVPAELHLNKDWLIVYYAKNPITQKLERQRLRVPKIKNNAERIRFAKKTVVEINEKLLQGWSPYLNEIGKNFKGWNEAIADFKKYLEKQFKDGMLRWDSCRTYTSNLSLVEQFIREKKISINFVLQYDKKFCWQYLDWIYLERENSPRTRNNHLIFLRLLGNYFLSRGILAENPTIGIKLLPKLPKKRVYIPLEIRNEIKKEIITLSDGYYCICSTIYYCMIRNTELGKMKVNFVDLQKSTIFIPKEISKNKKDEHITIPEDLLPIISNHIKNAKPNHYLFSNVNFLPGEIQMEKKKIYRKWLNVRKKIIAKWERKKIMFEFKKEYQFYSLKDTGITDLFLLGLPAIKIRDQARHSSVQITELYTPRNMGCDEILRFAGSKF